MALKYRKNFLLKGKNKSEAYQNALVSALKYCYKLIYNREVSERYIVRPKRSKRLPGF